MTPEAAVVEKQIEAAEPAPAVVTPPSPPAAPPQAPVDAPTGDPASVEPTKQTWPDNWRDELAGTDEGGKNKLARMGSVKDLYDSYRSLEKKLAEGGKTTPKPDASATPEQVADYRKSLGVPETFDKYDIKLPDGFHFGENDKPSVDLFLKDMHESNASPEIVNKGLNAYVKILEQQAARYKEKDNADKAVFEDTMRGEWGNEYRANLNMVGNFIQGAPESVRGMIMHGRGPDGTALANNPDFVRWIGALSRELNPAATIMNTSGRDVIDSIDEQLAGYEKEMKTDISAWHKNTVGKANYDKLTDAKNRLEKRKAR